MSVNKPLLRDLIPEHVSGQGDRLTSQQRTGREGGGDDLSEVTIKGSAQQVTGDVGATGEVSRANHRDAVGLQQMALDAGALAGLVGTVDELLVLKQRVELCGAQGNHHVIGTRINVLLFQLDEQVSHGSVELSRVQAVASSSKGLLRAAEVTSRLTSSTSATVGRVGQQSSLDRLNEQGLIVELSNLLAMLLADFLTGVVAGLEGFQQGQHSAGQDNRINGQGALCEVSAGTVDRCAGGGLLKRRLTHSEVGDSRSTLNRAEGNPALQGGLAFNGGFHDAGVLFQVQRGNRASRVRLAGANDSIRVVKCHDGSL